MTKIKFKKQGITFAARICRAMMDNPALPDKEVVKQFPYGERPLVMSMLEEFRTYTAQELIEIVKGGEVRFWQKGDKPRIKDFKTWRGE